MHGLGPTPPEAGQIPPAGGFAAVAPGLDSSRVWMEKGAVMKWALKIVGWVAGYVI
jgi:hypothetical protein